MKSSVGCCFQRTQKTNTHKITPRRKAYLTFSKRFFFLANIGAMAIAPCTPSKAFKQQGGSPCQSKSQTL